jgi:hypothetical protein
MRTIPEERACLIILDTVDRETPMRRAIVSIVSSCR